MFDVLLQMVGLILCGVIWRLLRPAGLETAMTRKVLTSLVYYLLLPAMVISVLWKTNLGTGSLIIAGAAAFGILIGLILSFITCRFCRNQNAEAGAIILAVTFPNATYMGLPVLEATFGSWGRSIAIQYDLFACTPLLFTLGMMLAMRFGSGDEANGKLFPFGFLHILRGFKKYDTVDFYFAGVHPEANARKLLPVMTLEMFRVLKQHGVKYIETNRELETNVSITSIWSKFGIVSKRRTRIFKKQLAAEPI